MVDNHPQPYSLSVKTDGRIDLKGALKEATPRADPYGPTRKYNLHSLAQSKASPNDSYQKLRQSGKNQVGEGEAYPGTNARHARNLTDLNKKEAKNSNFGARSPSPSSNNDSPFLSPKKKGGNNDLNFDIMDCLTKSKEDILLDGNDRFSLDNQGERIDKAE